jgi:hypothetical protein
VGSLLLVAFTPEHFADRRRPKVQVALDGKPERAAGSFKLGEHEVAPLALHADDEPEEKEVPPGTQIQFAEQYLLVWLIPQLFFTDNTLFH